MQLGNRVAVVTGAGQGIGQAIAEKFVQEGALVVIGELIAERGEETAGRIRDDGLRAQAIQLDVTSGESCAALTRQIAEEHGRIDILINSAGVFVPGKSEDIREEDWHFQIDVMLTGPFLMTQAVVRESMIPQRCGSIVHIASINGMGGWPMRAAYTAAKAGLIKLNEVLATEWAQYNIRLNCVSPGVTRTEMVTKAIDDGLADMEQFEQRTPLGRMAEVGEIADVVLFLASDRALYHGTKSARRWGLGCMGQLECHRFSRGGCVMGSPPLFTDKTVVITGSAGGLGLEMGRRFAEADAVVVLTDVDAELGRRAAESLCTQGARAQYEMLDVRIPGQSVDLVDRLVEEYGTIDVWVNNAGVAHKGPAEVLPADQWRETIDVMLSGAFYCSQAVSGPMLARGEGVIVNIASVIGCSPIEGRVAYGTAKAGLMMLTESLGIEWARRGVRVVGVAPAVVMTDMVRKGLEEGTATVEAYERRTPMRRLGTPDEIADAVLYLASDEASYITADTLRVDGGWTAYQYF